MNRLEIPLTFRSAPAWPATLDWPSLHYTGLPYAPKPGARLQPVLAGRTVLRPEIDLAKYRGRAVVDWIEVRLDTPGRHQARNMQPRIDKHLKSMGSAMTVHVSGPNRETPHNGSAFILRFQQPQPWELAKALKWTCSEYCPGRTSIGGLKIAGIEVSVDFYVRDSAHIDQDRYNLLRWQMVDLLRRHLRPHPVLTEKERCHPRFYMKEGSRNSAAFCVEQSVSKLSGGLRTQAHRFGLDEHLLAPLRPGAHHAIPIDTTSYIGARDFPVMLRVMDKTTDRRDPASGSVVALDPEHWRARIEVTLREDEEYNGPYGAGLDTLRDLYGYNFRDIRTAFFEFFLPTLGEPCETKSLPFSSKVTESTVFERSGVYGLDRLHRAVSEINMIRYKRRDIGDRPMTLGKKGRLVSFTDLNRRFDTALRGLTGDWRDALSPVARSVSGYSSSSA